MPLLLGFLPDRSPIDHRLGHVVTPTTICGFLCLGVGTYGHEAPAWVLQVWTSSPTLLLAAALVVVIGAWLCTAMVATLDHPRLADPNTDSVLVQSRMTVAIPDAAPLAGPTAEG